MPRKRVELLLHPLVVRRLRRAARMRRLSLPAFVVEASMAVADDTLAPVHVEGDPFARRPVARFQTGETDPSGGEALVLEGRYLLTAPRRR